MKALKSFKNKILYRLLGIKRTYDKEDEQAWLVSVAESRGFKSYLHFRDIQILKDIATKVGVRDFQSALELNGRRLEILRIAAEASKELHKLELSNSLDKFKEKKGI